ncbi:hypothetical protein GCK32_016811 [Trichostrongylus colubriformis]|uniref:Uncharacterized protein n=1 Tax=Trichostrongylus colubriformis TaxID=6319 RepID=A0AAN8FYQ5_TRICO
MEGGRQCMQPCTNCCQSISEKASYASSDLGSSVIPAEERQKSSWLTPFPDYPSAYTSPNHPDNALEEYLDATDGNPPKYEDTFGRSESLPSIPSKDHSRSPLDRSRKGSRLSGIPEEDSGLGSENGDRSLGRSRKLPPSPSHKVIQKENTWNIPQSRNRELSSDERLSGAGAPLLQASLQTSVEEEETSQLSDSLSTAAPKLFVAVSDKDRQTTL